MIRRSTWVLLAVFVLALGVTIYLDKTSTSLVVKTPTATPLPSLLPGWENKRVTVVEFEDSTGALTRLERTAENTWKPVPPVPGKAIDQGKVLSLILAIATSQVNAQIETNIDAEATGLNHPSYVIRLLSSEGEQKTIQIGKLNPTQTGYYVQTGQVIQVVNSADIEAVIEQLSIDKLAIETTPVPAGPQEPAGP